MDYVVVTRMAKGMYRFRCAPMETQDSYENQICLLSHFVPKDFEIQTHNYFMLWKATSIGLSRLHVPSPQVWAIAPIVADTLGHVVQQYVLNQS
jgi:hypothetical protein